MGRLSERRLHIDHFTDNHLSQLRSASDLDCYFMAILSGREPPGPRTKNTLWSNTRERTQSEEKEQAEDNSYSKGVKVLLKETARKSYPDPEIVDNRIIAHLKTKKSVTLDDSWRSLDTTYRCVLALPCSCDYS